MKFIPLRSAKKWAYRKWAYSESTEITLSRSIEKRKRRFSAFFATSQSKRRRGMYAPTSFFVRYLRSPSFSTAFLFCSPFIFPPVSAFPPPFSGRWSGVGQAPRLNIFLKRDSCVSKYIFWDGTCLIKLIIARLAGQIKRRCFLSSAVSLMPFSSLPCSEE